jgi:hypothetical protein
MPVRSKQKDEGEIPINSEVEHQGTVRLCLPTCTGDLEMVAHGANAPSRLICEFF